MDKPKTVAQRINEARQSKGLSVQELAERAGCSEEYLEWVEISLEITHSIHCFYIIL